VRRGGRKRENRRKKEDASERDGVGEVRSFEQTDLKC